MNDAFEVLEKFKAGNHTLVELKEFVVKNEYLMKFAFDCALENSDFFILYDSLLTILDVVPEINKISESALSYLNDPFCNWLEVYSFDYEVILLVHFSEIVKNQLYEDSEFIPVSFPSWKISKSDLSHSIQFLKTYAMKSDYYLLENENEINNLLKL